MTVTFNISGGRSIVLTSIFHAALNFFLSHNEALTASQREWLMPAAWGTATVIVVLVSRSAQGSASQKQG